MRAVTLSAEDSSATPLIGRDFNEQERPPSRDTHAARVRDASLFHVEQPANAERSRFSLETPLSQPDTARAEWKLRASRPREDRGRDSSHRVSARFCSGLGSRQPVTCHTPVANPAAP